MRCSACSRLGYLFGEVTGDPEDVKVVELALFACGDDRLVCRGCVVRLIDEATAVCRHGIKPETCFPCEILRAAREA